MKPKYSGLTEEQYQEVVDKLQNKSLAEELFDGVHIHGFSRVKVCAPGDDNSFVGDSGFCGANQVVNLGFNQYLVSSLGSIAGSKYITHAALGTGTQPGAADTSLQNEVGTRTAITAATSSGSKTLRLTATFAAGWHTSASAHNISNIGLFNTSSGGTIFCGNTYASSSCASNQAVNITYDIVFA